MRKAIKAEFHDDANQEELISKATPAPIKWADRLMVVACILLIIAIGVWGYCLVKTLAMSASGH